MSGGNGGGLHNTGGAGGTGYTGQNGGAGTGYVQNQSGSTLTIYTGGGGGGGGGYNTAGSGGKGASGGAGGAGGTKNSRNGVAGPGDSGGGAGYAGGTGSQHPFGTLSYAGGNGGNGGTGSSDNRVGGGGGGAGGAGFFTEKTATATMTFSASATGGSGGNGGAGAGGNAGGGDGGAGLVDGVANASLTFAANYTAKGGAGGSGGGGSSGGAGIVLYNSSASADPTLTNNGTAIGGSGGTSTSGTGGTGGAGVKFATTQGTFKNTGSIQGGSGGTGTTGGGAYGAGLVGAGLTVENNGSITGGGMGATQADAITFQSGANILALGSKSSISGAVDIQSGMLKFDQSALAGAPLDATLAAPITGAGSVVKVGTGTLTLSTAGTYQGGTTISAGTLDLGAAMAAGTGPIAFGTLSGTAQATLDIDSGAQSPGSIFANTLNGFNASSVLDLKGFVVTQAGYAVGTLILDGTVNGQTQTTTEYYKVADPSSTAFTTMSDNAGGTDVMVMMVCFAAGTRIRTARGDALVEVAVEDLRVGDLAVTASGALRPIRWLGHRTIDCRNHPRPDAVIPVRIRAHAFGDNRPARDLLVSPGHAIALDLLGEVLIPAYALLNGLTVVAEPVDRVTYWHVELDGHDILIAENQPTESYLDMGNRAFFAHGTGGNTVVDLAAPPDARPAARTSADFCRPFHESGALVETVRAQMRRRAVELGWRVVSPQPWAGVRLKVDGKSLLPQVDPDTSRMSARFALPPAARDIWLVCPTAVPAEVDPNNGDARALGLCLGEVVVDDGWVKPRRIDLADPRLCVGFHRIEADHRWTAGTARLPADLFGGMSGPAFLRLNLFAPPLPRWQAPETKARAGLDHAQATRPRLSSVA